MNVTAPQAKPLRNALVIEGGGIRGSFAAGVLSELQRQGGAPYDAVYGTSAGAACAAYFVSGQADLAVTVWKDRTYGRHLVSLSNLLRGVPAMDVEGLLETFRNGRPLRVDKIDESPSQLFISMTDCEFATTRMVRATSSNVLSALHASMALPVAYGKTVTYEGRAYVDGGICDPIPFSDALRRGAQKITVVLTQPRDYQKTYSRWGQTALELNLRAYPNLWARHRDRPALYNQQLAQLTELETEGRVTAIRPQTTLPTSRISRSRPAILETIELGRAAARDAIARGVL